MDGCKREEGESGAKGVYSVLLFLGDCWEVLFWFKHLHWVGRDTKGLGMSCKEKDIPRFRNWPKSYIGREKVPSTICRAIIKTSAQTLIFTAQKTCTSPLTNESPNHHWTTAYTPRTHTTTYAFSPSPFSPPAYSSLTPAPSKWYNSGSASPFR